MNKRLDGPLEVIALRQFTKLTGRHRIMVRMHMAGIDGQTIADYCHCAPSTVSAVINSALGKRAIEELSMELDAEAVLEQENDPVRELLHEEAMNSLMTLLELRDDKGVKAEIRMKTAMDLLDRDGYNPTEKHKVDSTINLEKTVQDNIGKAVLDLTSEYMADMSYVKRGTDNDNNATEEHTGNAPPGSGESVLL